MTKLLMCFPKHEGDGLYFDCYGHSEYRSSLGWNDCCVAVSTLCVMLINYVKDKYDIEPMILDEGHVRIEIEEPDDMVIEVFRAAERQFLWLSEEYDGQIKVY